MIKITAEQTPSYTFLQFPVFDSKGWIEIQVETATGRFCNAAFRIHTKGNPATILVDSAPILTPEQERHSQDDLIPDGE